MVRQKRSGQGTRGATADGKAALTWNEFQSVHKYRGLSNSAMSNLWKAYKDGTYTVPEELLPPPAVSGKQPQVLKAGRKRATATGPQSLALPQQPICATAPDADCKAELLSLSYRSGLPFSNQQMGCIQPWVPSNGTAAAVTVTSGAGLDCSAAPATGYTPYSAVAISHGDRPCGHMHPTGTSPTMLEESAAAGGTLTSTSATIVVSTPPLEMAAAFDEVKGAARALATAASVPAADQLDNNRATAFAPQLSVEATNAVAREDRRCEGQGEEADGTQQLPSIQEVHHKRRRRRQGQKRITPTATAAAAGSDELQTAAAVSDKATAADTMESLGSCRGVDARDPGDLRSSGMATAKDSANKSEGAEVSPEVIVTAEAPKGGQRDVAWDKVPNQEQRTFESCGAPLCTPSATAAAVDLPSLALTGMALPAAAPKVPTASTSASDPKTVPSLLRRVMESFKAVLWGPSVAGGQPTARKNVEHGGPEGEACRISDGDAECRRGVGTSHVSVCIDAGKDWQVNRNLDGSAEDSRPREVIELRTDGGVRGNATWRKEVVEEPCVQAENGRQGGASAATSAITTDDSCSNSSMTPQGGVDTCNVAAVVDCCAGNQHQDATPKTTGGVASVLPNLVESSIWNTVMDEGPISAGMTYLGAGQGKESASPDQFHHGGSGCEMRHEVSPPITNPEAAAFIEVGATTPSNTDVVFAPAGSCPLASAITSLHGRNNASPSKRSYITSAIGDIGCPGLAKNVAIDDSYVNADLAGDLTTAVPVAVDAWAPGHDATPESGVGFRYKAGDLVHAAGSSCPDGLTSEPGSRRSTRLRRRQRDQDLRQQRQQAQILLPLQEHSCPPRPTVDRSICSGGCISPSRPNDPDVIDLCDSDDDVDSMKNGGGGGGGTRETPSCKDASAGAGSSHRAGFIKDIRDGGTLQPLVAATTADDAVAKGCTSRAPAGGVSDDDVVIVYDKNTVPGRRRRNCKASVIRDNLSGSADIARHVSNRENGRGCPWTTAGGEPAGDVEHVIVPGVLGAAVETQTSAEAGLQPEPPVSGDGRRAKNGGRTKPAKEAPSYPAPQPRAAVDVNVHVEDAEDLVLVEPSAESRSPTPATTAAAAAIAGVNPPEGIQEVMEKRPEGQPLHRPPRPANRGVPANHLVRRARLEMTSTGTSDAAPVAAAGAGPSCLHGSPSSDTRGSADPLGGTIQPSPKRAPFPSRMQGNVDMMIGGDLARRTDGDGQEIRQEQAMPVGLSALPQGLFRCQRRRQQHLQSGSAAPAAQATSSNRSSFNTCPSTSVTAAATTTSQHHVHGNLSSSSQTTLDRFLKPQLQPQPCSSSSGGFAACLATTPQLPTSKDVCTMPLVPLENEEVVEADVSSRSLSGLRTSSTLSAAGLAAAGCVLPPVIESTAVTTVSGQQPPQQQSRKQRYKTRSTSMATSTTDRRRLRERDLTDDDPLFAGFSPWARVRPLKAVLDAVRPPARPGIYEWGARAPGDTRVLAFYLGKAGGGRSRETLRSRFNKYASTTRVLLGPQESLAVADKAVRPPTRRELQSVATKAARTAASGTSSSDAAGGAAMDGRFICEPHKAGLWRRLQSRGFELFYRYRVCVGEVDAVVAERALHDEVNYAGCLVHNGSYRELLVWPPATVDGTGATWTTSGRAGRTRCSDNQRFSCCLDDYPVLRPELEHIASVYQLATGAAAGTRGQQQRRAAMVRVMTEFQRGVATWSGGVARVMAGGTTAMADDVEEQVSAALSRR
ncbi:hypothetical protein VaNZ11_003426 [Volvox africanus]|uniref:Uncharacterized protein n=1 Tax=Volvox africanus TaxID=51714 RepID=A0ABQ5RVY5_9CHLO|nr:hypothetical protein VaNZ11_003426 [Volvox africanus]